MVDKQTKIQFFLYRMIACKLDGFNAARGLQKLGYNANYIYQDYNKGELFDNPEYAIFIKPRIIDDSLIIKLKKQGTKVILFMEDETLVPERRGLYDFIISPTTDWKKRAAIDYPEIPCYLVNQEWDYYTTKTHTPDSFKIVTTGYMENLKVHFNILPIIEQTYSDITIVSNWVDREVFPKVKFENFIPPWDAFLDIDFDKIMVEQFKKYDVGVITQHSYYPQSGRTADRLKSLIYAGLPVIALDNESHRDIWVNGEELKVFYAKEESDWLKYLKILEDYKIRQEIVDYNYEKIKKYAGVEQAALTYIRAIEQYEQENITKW